MALAKAFGEALERYTMLNFFNKSGSSKLTANHLKWSADSEFVFESEQSAVLPPVAFQNSNGWAAHFNLSSAIRNGLFEAIERHSLQLSFWRHGFEFVHCSEQRTWNNYRFHFAFFPSGFRGVNIQLCAVEHPSYEGYFLDIIQNWKDQKI